MLGDHDVDARAAALELVRQDLTTQKSFAAADVARDFTGALARYANGDGVLAARHGIHDAERHGNWGRRRAANRCGITARSRRRLTATSRRVHSGK